MGTTCELQLARAMTSLDTMDLHLAGAVIEEDVNLNALYKELEDDAVKLLARRTPLAGDLRFLLAVMRTGTELERIGDYAANIARRVTELGNGNPVPGKPVALILEIGNICCEMITDVVASFLSLDITAALDVWHRDDAVDRKFARLMTDLRAQMQQNKDVVDACTRMIFMGRCLERIGDHITNVAESIYYIETGETYIGTLET